MLVVHVHKMHAIVFSPSSWYDCHWQENQFPSWLHCFLDSVHATARWHLLPMRRGKSTAMYAKLTLARHCLRFDMRQNKFVWLKLLLNGNQKSWVDVIYFLRDLLISYPIYTFDNHTSLDMNNQQHSHIVSESVQHIQTTLLTHSGEPNSLPRITQPGG